MKSVFILDEPRLIKLEDTLNEMASELKKLNKQPKSNWLGSKETAVFLKVSTRTLQNYRDKGKIPFSKFGDRILFKESDLEEFLDRYYIPMYNEKKGRA